LSNPIFEDGSPGLLPSNVIENLPSGDVSPNDADIDNDGDVDDDDLDMIIFAVQNYLDFNVIGGEPPVACP